jgi:hypothetical protein
MGAFVVLDRSPKTEWRMPLQNGKEFLCLDVLDDADDSAISGTNHSGIPKRIATWLKSVNRIRHLSENAATYFDRELSPTRLAGVICVAVSRSSLGPNDCSDGLPWRKHGDKKAVENSTEL